MTAMRKRSCVRFVERVMFPELLHLGDALAAIVVRLISIEGVVQASFKS